MFPNRKDSSHKHLDQHLGIARGAGASAPSFGPSTASLTPDSLQSHNAAHSHPPSEASGGDAGWTENSSRYFTFSPVNSSAQPGVTDSSVVPTPASSASSLDGSMWKSGDERFANFCHTNNHEKGLGTAASGPDAGLMQLLEVLQVSTSPQQKHGFGTRPMTSQGSGHSANAHMEQGVTRPQSSMGSRSSSSRVTSPPSARSPVKSVVSPVVSAGTSEQ